MKLSTKANGYFNEDFTTFTNLDVTHESPNRIGRVCSIQRAGLDEKPLMMQIIVKYRDFNENILAYNLDEISDERAEDFSEGVASKMKKALKDIPAPTIAMAAKSREYTLVIAEMIAFKTGFRATAVLAYLDSLI